MLGFAQKNSIN